MLKLVRAILMLILGFIIFFINNGGTKSQIPYRCLWCEIVKDKLYVLRPIGYGRFFIIFNIF